MAKSACPARAPRRDSIIKARTNIRAFLIIGWILSPKKASTRLQRAKRNAVGAKRAKMPSLDAQPKAAGEKRLPANKSKNSFFEKIL